MGWLVISSTFVPQTLVKGYDTDREELRFDLFTSEWETDCFIGAELIKSYLEAVGFAINHVPLRFLDNILRDYGGSESVRPYDLIYTTQSRNPFRPTDLNMLHSQNDYPGGSNYFGFHNPVLDNHLDAMMNGPLDEVQFHVYQQQMIAAEECPYIQVLNKEDAMPLRKGMDGLIYTPHGLISWNNPLTQLNVHNTTNLPDDRDGLEWVMRYFKFIRDGNPDGMLYYEILTGRTAFVDSLLWECLVQTNETGGYIPWLAESYSISEDGMTFNFTLRDGIQWHDFDTSGEYVDADDVVFSYNYINDAWDAGLASYSPVIDIASCTVLPDGTIQFVMEEMDTWAISYLFTELKIFPKHIFETVPYNDATWHDLTNMTTKVGTGPYKFDEVEAANPPIWWKFVRNDDYWFTGANPNCLTGLEPIASAGGSDPTITQYPRMERFTIRVITGTDATVAALRNGAIDLTRYMWYEIAVVAEQYPDEIEIVIVPSWYRNILYINNQISPLTDPVVRQAIAYALDYDSIAQIEEYVFPVYNQYLPLAIYGTQWHNPVSDIYRYNVQQANQILDDAGYLDTDGDGVREIPSAIEGINTKIQNLPESAFKNNAEQRKNALSNKLTEVTAKINAGEYERAINKLQKDIRAKCDGSLGGNPKNDWIIDPTAQQELCAMIDVFIAYLETMI